MSARPNANRSSGRFGLSFIDGEKLQQIFRKPGGLVASSKVESKISSIPTSKQSKKEPCLNYNPEDVSVPSIQKLGANKFVTPGDIKKPLLFKKLMGYIQKELRVLGATNDPPGSPRRLQILGEVFDCFIFEFKTYEPILTDIKREYEITIENQKQELSQFDIVKSKLSVMEFRMAKEIQKIQYDYGILLTEKSNEICDMHKQLEEKTISILKLEETVKRLVEEQKRQQNEKHEQPELTELKQLSQEYKMYEKRTQDLLDMKEEQVVSLLTNLKKVQEELLDATAQNVKTKAQLKDTVQQTSEKIQNLETEIRKLSCELELEKNKVKDTVEKPSNFYSRQLELSTPDWEYIQSKFSKSIKDIWTKMKQLDYNDAIVDLIRELNTSNASGQHEIKARNENVQNEELLKRDIQKPKRSDQYFNPKGLDSSIPKYLRTKNKVLNRFLSKKQCLLLIFDIWEAKILNDRTSKPMSLGEFLYLYLKKRFGTQELICEWGYNLTEALKVYRGSSVDIALFLGVLDNYTEESVYYDFRWNIEKLKSSVSRMDLEVHGQKKLDFLELDEFMRALCRIFPYKSRKQLAYLERSLMEDSIGEKVTYPLLFKGEAESQFFELFKEQELESRHEFIKDIEEGLRRIPSDSISVADALKLIKSKDPDKDQPAIELLLLRAFEISAVENLKPKIVLSKKLFMENLQKGPLYKGKTPSIAIDLN